MFLIFFIMVAVKAAVQDDEEVVPTTNQTIQVDDYLTFTYSTEMLPSVEMFGLVPNMTNEEGEDTSIETFVGHFELNLTDLENGPEWSDDSSMRFCLQLFPKYNTDGSENTKGVNSENAERYRMRFFNKQINEFTFYPQIGSPFKTETDSEGNQVKTNLDWNHRTYPEDLNKDFLDKLCSMEFDPKLEDTGE